MASVSNDGLSCKSMKKRLSENGYHSYLSIIPKYKVRKVSAVRDFPPGCGKNSPKVDLNHEQNAMVSSGKDKANISLDGVKDYNIKIESQPIDVLDCLVNSEEQESLDRLVGKVVEANMTAIANGVVEKISDYMSLGFELPKDLENSEMELPKETKDVQGDISMKENDERTLPLVEDFNGEAKTSVREIEVVTDEPTSVSEAKPGDISMKENEERTLSLVENVDGEPKTSVREIEDATYEPTPVSEAKQCSPPQQLISVTEHTSVEHTSVAPKDKYRKRRVSAARDFPPFCGTNAPLPIQQACFVPTEESKDVTGFDKVKNGGIETQRDVMDNGGLQERLLESGTADSLGERDIASRKEGVSEQTTMFHSEEPEGIQHDYDGSSQVERTLVMPEIMTKKEDDAGVVGKDTAEYSKDENENIRHEMVWPIRQVACPLEQKSVDGPVSGNEIVSQVKSNKRETAANAVGSGHEIFKPIVQGLMAEPNCPWRKEKQTNLDCAASRKQVEKPIEKQTSDQTETAINAFDSGHEIVKPIVQGLMAEPNCPWRKEKQISLDCAASGNQVEKPTVSWRKKKAVAKKSNPSGMKRSAAVGKATDELSSALVVIDDEGSDLQAASNDGTCSLNRKAQHQDSPVGQGQREFDVTLPPFGPNSSSHGDARSKVRETLRLFQAICRKLLQEEESKSRTDEAKLSRQGPNRIDLQAAKMIKERGKEVNTGQHIVGEVPGVEVGDEFQYRVELAIVGVHRLYQAGIDYMKQGNMLVAISIVSSGVYDDAKEDADVLIYSGQGGNVVGKAKNPEDQKLERGNLALKNSISVKNPVRVIRGSKETKTSESSGDGKGKVVTTYVYDGLYYVDNFWTEQGTKGKMVFMFKLVRIPGQPELAWKEVKSSKKSKVRHGICVHDITEGKETLPINAVNLIDGEKPPSFEYIKKIIYPDWFHPSPPKGCDCTGKCADSKKCSCAVKNGGEIPYNRNGAIVEVKPLVYECGPHCKCPPSCYNRVSQHGIKLPLEIFKTGSRGWGVRALTSIPSGTFICEYVGELLEDKEAERRIGSDEYLFDIGQNYSDCSLNPSEQAELGEIEEAGYTIDAAEHGNVGRFINHSCSPNLYAQNVLYDYEDKKIPHIMLFAADNIPPLTELSYHYNYSVDQVYDSDGKIKVKECFCGSSECSGRMY